MAMVKPLLNGRLYRVSIKSFPDYKHLLQENYVEYKHIFFQKVTQLKKFFYT
jgi:3-deoxy-D-manno-octulosonic-acid transferase